MMSALAAAFAPQGRDVGLDAVPESESTGAAREDSADSDAGSDGALGEIDEIARTWNVKQQDEMELARHIAAKRSAFAEEFARVCSERIRPVMEAIIDRLQSDGGDGVITERPEDVSRSFTHRLTLWMSLAGKIEGPPRQDRHPYIQFDAHPDAEIVTISEGDIWQGKGGNHSGTVGERTLSDLVPAWVEQEVVAILRRSLG
jgi:hypothetical protein